MSISSCVFATTLSVKVKAPICSNNEAIHHNSGKILKRVNSDSAKKLSTEFLSLDSPQPIIKKCFFCERRRNFPIQPSRATHPRRDYTGTLKEFRPPKPDWYEESFASFLNIFTKAVEAEVDKYKSQMFSNLKGEGLRILEIGIGTGPNLSYYAIVPDVEVIGIDPNPKMEKYAQSSAVSAGLSASNFEFIQAVGEVIPLDDASVDVIVGTLVLCSVKDVDMTLKEVLRVLRPGGIYLFMEHVAAKDGTFLSFIQRVLDPLQQTILDGCHLSRETGNNISMAGFSSVELNPAFLFSFAFINPFVYGIAYK